MVKFISARCENISNFPLVRISLRMSLKLAQVGTVIPQASMYEEKAKLNGARRKVEYQDGRWLKAALSGRSVNG
jgi:hypothetical protein